MRQSQTVRVLTSVQIIVYFGSWFSHVGVLTLLSNLGASPFILSLAVATAFLPSLFHAPFTGAIIDRASPVKLMNALLLVEAATTFCFIFIEKAEYIWILLLLMYIKMSAASLYFMSEMSLLPKILKSSELKLANEIHSIVWSFSFTAGMALGGLAVRFLGIKTAFLIDASLFIGAIFIFKTLNLDLQGSKTHKSYIASFVEGISYISKRPKLMAVIALHASVGLTVFDGIVAVLAQNEYKNVLSIALAIGFIGAVRSAALVIGPFLFSKYVDKKRLLWLFVGQGVAVICWAFLSGDFWFSLIGAFLCGLFTTTIWSYTMTMLQDMTDKEFYGRVVSVNDMCFTAVAAFASLAFGALMEKGFSGFSSLLSIGVLFLVVAAFYRLLSARTL